MNGEIYLALSAQVADLIETVGDEVLAIESGEMADGSGRAYTLVTTLDRVNQLEQQFRVASPAPEGGPAWTRVYTEWTVEVRVGDGWTALVEPEPVDEPVPTGTVELPAGDAAMIAELLDTFAGVDEGEYLDLDEVERLRGLLLGRAEARS